jgi:hypothetical protein
MSIIERLFPPSELEALRATPYDHDITFSAPDPKRRKLSHGSHSGNTPSGDSGYNSDEGSNAASPTDGSSSRKRSHDDDEHPNQPPHKPVDAAHAERIERHRKLIQSALFHKYISSLPAHERSKRLRTYSDPSSLPSQAQAAIYAHLARIRARARAQSVNMQHAVLAQQNDESNAPSTTTSPTFINSRLFDGLRLTSHERSMLHSLIPADYASTRAKAKTTGPVQEQSQSEAQANTKHRTERAFSYPQRRESQIVVPPVETSTYKGFAMPATLDEEEETNLEAFQAHSTGENLLKQQLRQQYAKDVFALFGTENQAETWGSDYGVAVDQSEGTGKVEDFFDLEEACGDGDSPGYAAAEPETEDTAMATENEP